MMTARRPNLPGTIASLALVAVVSAAGARASQDPPGAREGGGFTVGRDGERLTVGWPIGGGERATLRLDPRPGKPLFEAIEVQGAAILKGVDPVYFVTVGTRENPPGRPPGMSVFNVFFDSPAKRPFRQYRAKLVPTQVDVNGRGSRLNVRVEGLTAGPFKGALEVTLYEGAPLVHVEAVVRTDEPNRAFLYDAGLAATGNAPSWDRYAWTDTEGAPQSATAKANDRDHPLAVRHRALAVGSGGGSVAAFPPPHQYFFPRDLTENLKTVWYGRGHRGLDDRLGFGVRQAETGGGNFVPWFNAPPGTTQRLGVFYLLSSKPPTDALRGALAYTHGDRFPDLPGRVTLTSHWHMALAVTAMKEQAEGKGRTTPDLVKMFKDMNVRVVHLAEFHGDGHPQDPGPLRLPELAAMFDECRRLSDDRLLVLPGEEANVHLGVRKPNQHPGHWLYLFPRPVSWTMTRAPGQPFAEDDRRYGRVYHVGDRADMLRLLREERGLAWTAHPRIKASSWAPDAYRDADYFNDPVWLGGAWKAMPADLSSPRLGRRVLDLLDDMANWGARKYVPGEVDVFKIDHTHELYGHMNINYLALDRAPRYDDDWSPVLDALRRGRFFVTTGEVLLTRFTAGGLESGSTLMLPPDGRPELTVSLRWTFPLRFAEVISGDGKSVYRERIDLSDTPAFGQRTLTLRPDLSGRTWVRIEAWDVAANGAFSQPVWLLR